MKQYPAIEDYFLIGDLYSAALVSREGSVDWLCLPYFDSSSVFGRLLDSAGGSFTLDTTGYDVSCAYVKDTAIVERTLIKAGITIVMRDFMAPCDGTTAKDRQYLVRTLRGQDGKADVTFSFHPKPQYGSVMPEVTEGDGRLEVCIDEYRLSLYVPPEAQTKRTADGYTITIPIQASEEKSLILAFGPDSLIAPEAAADLEARTAGFWRRWVGQGTYFDFCRDNLVRSAITLKLMQFAPTGAMVAAPTTSLPETIGGVRNWDYRYVWIRDATFTLYAFYVLGYTEEAERFFNFIYGIVEKCSHDNFDVSLMYTIFGEPVPVEQTLEHLAGYQRSRPVRIGNGAAEQFQLDVYGALIDAYYFASKTGLSADNQERSRTLIMDLVHKIDELWQETDSGIWEVRTQTQHYTYSKVMCWVGADRARRLQETLGLSDGDVLLCERLADSVRDWTWEHCYSRQMKNLTQYPATTTIDSTNFVFVLLQFLDKHQPRTKEIIERTRAELSHHDIFVYRYKGDDGLPGQEGAFILCSFWLISALAILEDTDAALRLFSRMDRCITPHGLLSEEIDPDSGRYLGNYPQAFSHLGYIMSAHYLHKYISRKQGV